MTLAVGPVSEEEKRRQYAHSRAVLFPPEDEDYGYVTLEAMLAAKPVLTCDDSGGPLEFVRDGETGRIVEPTPQALADAMKVEYDAIAASGLILQIDCPDLAAGWPPAVALLPAVRRGGFRRSHSRATSSPARWRS